MQRGEGDGGDTTFYAKVSNQSKPQLRNNNYKIISKLNRGINVRQVGTLSWVLLRFL
jgi:hypothetical protein